MDGAAATTRAGGLAVLRRLGEGGLLVLNGLPIGTQLTLALGLVTRWITRQETLESRALDDSEPVHVVMETLAFFRWHRILFALLLQLRHLLFRQALVVPFLGSGLILFRPFLFSGVEAMGYFPPRPTDSALVSTILVPGHRRSFFLL